MIEKKEKSKPLDEATGLSRAEPLTRGMIERLKTQNKQKQIITKTPTLVMSAKESTQVAAARCLIKTSGVKKRVNCRN